MSRLIEISAMDIAAGRKKGDWSSREVVSAHIERIHARNPEINALCTIAEEEALAEARRQDGCRACELGPLAGVPVAIKDVTETAGIRTTFGSSIHAFNVPAQDALVVRQLKRSGAIVIGKSNTPEFAAGANTKNELFGATVNPWDTSRTVGGSTGGGAAALADFMVPLAEGTDFGGSLRVPASFCGVVGLRPTAGITASHPVAQPWDVGRVNGPMARTAADVALMLSAIVGVEDLSPISAAPAWGFDACELPGRVTAFNAEGVRIHFARDIAGLGVDAEVAGVCEAALALVGGTGPVVEEIDLSLADGHEAYKTLRGQWMVCNYRDFLVRTGELNASLRRNIEAGLTVTALQVADARAKQREIWLRLLGALDHCTVIATPTVPIPPFPVDMSHPETINGRPMATYIDWLAQTYLITLSGFPAVSVPVGLDANGLPVGMQLVGKRFSEPTLLGLSEHIQGVIPLARSVRGR
jgi:amidase